MKVLQIVPFLVAILGLGCINSSDQDKISSESKAFADQFFSPERFLAWYHFVLQDRFPGDTGAFPLIMWPYNPFTHDSLFLKEYKQKTNNYYEIIGKYNEFVQGWNDASPDMIGPTAALPDSFGYIFNQDFGTDYDHRFRGNAIKSVGTDTSGVPNDTTWLFYHDGDIKRPRYFGYSARQDEFYNQWRN